jgi:hypothetical protein
VTRRSSYRDIFGKDRQRRACEDSTVKRKRRPKAALAMTKNESSVRRATTAREGTWTRPDKRNWPDEECPPV